MRRDKVRLVFGALMAAPLLLLAACAPNAPQDTLDPAGPVARQIDDLFRPVFWIAVGVFVLVEGLLVFALLRYRHRPGREIPEQIHGSKRLEIAWTLAPAVLLGAIAIPTIGTIFSLAGRPAGDVLDVNITARQFWWEAEYPGMDVIVANEIHIPTGRPVFLAMESEDVIHSFWVPRLAGKQDVNPGWTTHLTIEAEEPGTYFAQCAEYCGLSHANMRFRVIAQDPPEFERWVQEQQQPAEQPPDEILAIMTRPGIGCNGCHTIQGVEGFVGRVGPDLTHFGSRGTFAGSLLENTPENLAAWIRDAPGEKPGVLMPSFEEELSEQEVEALVAYLRSLQ